MTLFHRLVSRLADALFAVSLLAGVLMMLHVTTDVISRTLFNAPLAGTGEITATYYMIAVAFLPLAWITLRDQHVTADIFVSALPRALRAVIAVLVDLLVIVYVSAFVWQTWISALSRTERGEVWEILGGYLPVWPTRWLLPVAGAAMVLTMVFRLIARLTRYEYDSEGQN
ncbi:TRAP transporter small permease [Rhodobacter sp. NTK016B]|uniref:TRAP transporter small permease n=1 Tax=Rhodobacter sp. NTK016B TaxID=2759676 RepID=UPI001A8CCB40|nr:TRAP transporter small permease [Rhodobacter sp. NTK016B]MBN8291180.1 TRAP transporter small permease [Rhodobacter sp. NTK016B]